MVTNYLLCYEFHVKASFNKFSVKIPGCINIIALKITIIAASKKSDFCWQILQLEQHSFEICKLWK